jgi:hypothetical protein
MQTLQTTVKSFRKGQTISRSTQKAIRGGAELIFYYCRAQDECYPSAFQCRKGCGPGTNECISRFASNCPF